jgi:hypothetical protein
VPITNPFVIDVKNQVNMLNEASQKNYGRSYQMGDSNNLPIYLDAMIKDMDQQNETLGLIETTIELDLTELESLNLNVPIPNSEITLVGETFYVYSASKRYTFESEYLTLYLSRNRYKICDAIGVDYQFNSTKFQLENIVDRPIYFSVTNTNLYTALATTNDSAFVKIQFKDYNNSTINTLVKRLAVQVVGNSCFCYVETLDNIVFDTKAIQDGSNYALYNMTYCDDNGECNLVSIDIFTTKAMLGAASYMLPDEAALNFMFKHNETQVATLKPIYKDVAERLTFTIEVKKSN